MDQISNHDLRELIDTGQAPCLSIYFGTHRAGVDTLQDPIRLRNLIREAEHQLELSKEPAPAIRDLLNPLRELADQYAFWQHQADGLAIFRTKNMLRRYRLSFPVPELAVVGERFHLKPLFPAVDPNQRFYVLAISQDGARIYEGNSYSIREVEVPELARIAAAAPAARGPERKLQSHTATHQSSGRRFAIFHGHGGGEENRKEALVPFFRQVDEAVRKRLNSDGAPVALMGVDYLCPIYRQVSSISGLLAEEVHGNADGFSSAMLHRLSWAVASAHFRKMQDRAADEYHQLWHTPRASNELSEIVSSAGQGRVKSLFVALGVQKWKDAEDVLNAAALETFLTGGNVYVLPPDEVPGRRLAAAVFRY